MRSQGSGVEVDMEAGVVDEYWILGTVGMAGGEVRI
jgi:hypothetical protein